MCSVEWLLYNKSERWGRTQSWPKMRYYPGWGKPQYTSAYPVPVLIWNRGFSKYENWSAATFSDFVSLIHTIPYFSPFSYCYMKYTGVLTTLIQVSPIVQGTARLKTALTVEVGNVYTEVDVNADWAVHYLMSLMSTTDGRRTDLVVSDSVFCSALSVTNSCSYRPVPSGGW
jgi:hypothetical protein